jgi:hypothetical protein
MKYMKSIKLVILVFAFLIIPSFAYAFDVDTSWFNDSFNRADNDTVGNGWAEEEQGADVCKIQNNQLAIEDASINDVKCSHTLTEINTTKYVEFNTTIDLTQTDSMTFQFKNGVCPAGTVISEVAFHEDFTVDHNKDGSKEGNFTAGTEFKFQMKLDYTANTYSSYVDDVLIGTSAFQNIDGIDCVVFRSSTSNLIDQWDVDYIHIGDIVAVPPSGANQSITLNGPGNNSFENEPMPRLNVTVTDNEGNSMTVRFHKGDGTELYEQSGVANGSTVTYDYGFLSKGTTYDWYVNVTD